jgi:hypothetical protein
LDLEVHQEREEELVLFKERSANVFVQELGKLFDEEVLSLSLFNFRTILECSSVDANEEVDTVLIHWIDIHNLHQDEEEP